jgi:hypothetical protein
LIMLNDLLRVHESTAMKRAQQPKAEGLEMEYASRIMAARKLFGLEGLSCTFKVPIFTAIEVEGQPSRQQQQEQQQQ